MRFLPACLLLASVLWLLGCDGPDDTARRGPWFENVTERVGITISRTAADGFENFGDRIGAGVCVIDADQRPPLDLFFAIRPAEGVGSRLYVATPDLSYADETAMRGLADVGDPIGCLAFDADGDGDDDLLVTGVGTVRMFSNEGGTFVETPLPVSPEPSSLYASAAAGDLDGDGDLDLLVAGTADLDMTGFPSCGAVSCASAIGYYDHIGNLLLVRLEDGTYEDATARLAPGLGEPLPTLVVAINDLNGDGRQDMFIGHDMGGLLPNEAYVATDDGFEEAGVRLGLAYDVTGHGGDTMGWTAGDVNGDLRLDHATTSFELLPSAVFVCDESYHCADRGPDLGIQARAESFRWGNGFGDFDLDGDLDLIEATGHIFRDPELEALGSTATEAQRPNLFENEEGERLAAVTPEEEDALSEAHPARGLAVVDLDDDGRLDVVLATSHGAPAVLRNVRETRGHWLRVVLRGKGANAGAVGARVVVTQGSRSWVRERYVGEGFLGNFDPRLHFGIPASEPVDISVRWPDGTSTALEGVETDAEIRIEQP